MISRRAARFFLTLSLVVVGYGLCVVSTMREYPPARLILSADESTVVVVSVLNYPKNLCRYRVDVVDLVTGKRTLVRFDRSNRWTPIEVAISDDGRHLAMSSPAVVKIIGTGRQSGPRSRDFPLPELAYYDDVKFSQDGKFLYCYQRGAIGGFDLESGKYRSFAFPTGAAAVVAESADERVFFGLVFNEPRTEVEVFAFRNGMYESIGETRPWLQTFGSISSNGKSVLRSSDNSSGVEIIDFRSGAVIRQIIGQGINQYRWAGPEKIVDFSNGYTVYDAITGEISDTIQKVSGNAWQYKPGSRELMVVDRVGEITAYKSDGSSRILSESPYRWWKWNASLMIAAAVLWWLLWSVATRNKQRSFQAVADIILLYFLVLGVCLLRFLSDPKGPRLDSWEGIALPAVVFGGAAIFGLWLAFGVARWALRVSIGLLVTALCWGVLLLMCFHLQTSTAGWTLLFASFVVAQWMILFALGKLRVSLVHASDACLPMAPVPNGFRVRDLLLWTLGFALILLVSRGAETELPSKEFIYWISAKGAVLSLTIMIAIWASLGRTRWWIRLPIGIVAIPLPFLLLELVYAKQFQLTSAWYGSFFFSVSAVVFLSGLALRLNGYRFCQPLHAIEESKAILVDSTPSQGVV